MIIGHKREQEKLNQLFTKDIIPHALLFSGPEGIGKRTVAQWFLKKINCEGKNPPCKECSSCYEIEKGTHPDLMMIVAEDGEIKLAQIEELSKRVSYRGVRSRFKGIIINEAHLMNHQSQNALLKTLEEPSKDTIIILVTEHPHILLPTILSRSFEIGFSFVNDEDIVEKIDEKVAKLSFGRPGWALNYLNFPEKREAAEKMKKAAEEMLKEDFSFRFSVVKSIVEEGKEEEFLNYLLKVMEEELLLRIKKKKETKKISCAIKEIEELVLLSIKTNINMRLALEKIATII
jgi:DNA polymerase III subunit delta'